MNLFLDRPGTTVSPIDGTVPSAGTGPVVVHQS